MAQYVTKDQLKKITGKTMSGVFVDALNSTLKDYDITTPERIWHFLAQILHESGIFRYDREIWGPSKQQKRYDPPTTLAIRLGNTEVGDGFKYRGRGFIQLTGKNNYQKYSESVGVDFVEYPDMIISYPYVMDVAGWFWKTKKINDIIELDLSETDKVKAVTKRVNGGTTGLVSRTKWYFKCKAAIPVVEEVNVDVVELDPVDIEPTPITETPISDEDRVEVTTDNEKSTSGLFSKVIRSFATFFKSIVRR